MRDKWDARFIDLAALVGSWSQDPSTKVGAVIVDQNRRVVSVGFNGFAAGVDDSTERLETRETKYRMILHAEDNAIMFARQSLIGCTIYTTPFLPCAQCAARIIQAGIVRVVAPHISETDPAYQRWRIDLELAWAQYNEASVEVTSVAQQRTSPQ